MPPSRIRFHGNRFPALERHQPFLDQKIVTARVSAMVDWRRCTLLLVLGCVLGFSTVSAQILDGLKGNGKEPKTRSLASRFDANPVSMEDFLNFQIFSVFFSLLTVENPKAIGAVTAVSSVFPGLWLSRSSYLPMTGNIFVVGGTTYRLGSKLEAAEKELGASQGQEEINGANKKIKGIERRVFLMNYIGWNLALLIYSLDEKPVEPSADKSLRISFHWLDNKNFSVGLNYQF